MNNNNEWKDIPGYAGIYQININGQVRSVDRKHVIKRGLFKGQERSVKGKVLSEWKTTRGYRAVTLTVEGKHHTHEIHRLLKMTFDCLPPFSNAHCRHLDGNCLNNALSNLAWGTASENLHDRWRHERERAQTIQTHTNTRSHSEPLLSLG